MSKITPFVIGGMLGAGVALLYAPKAGEQTRSLIAEKVNALWGEAKDFGAGMPSSAKDIYNTALEKGPGILKDAPSKISGMASSVTSKGATGAAAAQDSDELREKIEAARKRIAAQVKENAEQSKAVDVAGAAE